MNIKGSTWFYRDEQGKLRARLSRGQWLELGSDYPYNITITGVQPGYETDEQDKEGSEAEAEGQEQAGTAEG